MNINAFKCNPTGSQVPPQFLVSLNAPMCIKNLLFGPLECFVYDANGKSHSILNTKPENYSYEYEVDKS